MADNNRNRQDSYRQQYDWNDDSNRQRNYEDEANYTNTENRGYRDSGRTYGSTGEGGWQSRYERGMGYGHEGDNESSYNPRQYGRQSEDYNSGTGQRGISSAYSDFGGDYSRERSRNLYDRGNQGMGRRDYENRENRIGGANYDRYGEYGRYDQNRGSHGGWSSQSNQGRSGYGGSDYMGRSDYGRSNWDRSEYGNRANRNRNYGSGESDERSWWDRTSDEVSSWFGDEDAERRRQQDRYRGGEYRGKGPKNYSRSDDRVKEDINDRLSDDPFIDASDIDVTVSNGEVTLTGTVDHRSTKRRAEDLAEAVSGVKNVENRLRVSQMTGGQTSGLSGTSSGTASQSSSPVAGSQRSRKESTAY